MTDKQTGKRRDVAQEITDRIIAAIEAGAPPWKRPWKSAFGSLRPLRNNGAPYKGVNILILWDRAGEKGFENPRWMTFRQAMALGGHVKKGERGVSVVYYGSTTKEVEDGGGGEGSEAERTFRFLKSYPVFNVEQVADLPAHFYDHKGKDVVRTPPPSQRKAFFDGVGAEIRHGGDCAFYHRGEDFIRMPPYGAFDNPERYFATLAHEVTHWTGAPGRLDRKKGRRYGDEDYAYEELVAEIGSAMIGAEIGLPPDHIEDHAAYVNAWLTSLRNDKRYILKAAAEAQKACDFVMAKTQSGAPGGETRGEPAQAGVAGAAA
ncbi:ArdC family protein [Hyphococcus sp.]|uniref:ArdC family protein n=1 Tax=Hyphococcus sp. TaxID=2038636 RepID=UPI0035C7089D